MLKGCFITLLKFFAKSVINPYVRGQDRKQETKSSNLSLQSIGPQIIGRLKWRGKGRDAENSALPSFLGRFWWRSLHPSTRASMVDRRNSFIWLQMCNPCTRRIHKSGLLLGLDTREIWHPIDVIFI